MNKFMGDVIKARARDGERLYDIRSLYRFLSYKQR